MASPLQFAYRTQKAIGVTNAAPVYQPLDGFVNPEGNLRCTVYSPCGRYLAWASSERVCIVDASNGATLSTLVVPNVYEVGFSPRGSYLSTWERPGKDENGDATKNFKVWRTIEDVADDDKQPLGRYVQKSPTGWNLQYTADEKLCARMVTNEIQFYNSDDLKTVWNKLRVEGVADFALAPGQSHNVAVFVPERKGQPAAVKVYNVPSFNAPISQKTFFKGDKVQLKWNSLGTSLIVLAQTDVDKSNKSYYGETTLYLLSANGTVDARLTLDKEGPIHDVTWSPTGKEFGVSYGYMPSKTTIFNHRAVANHSFQIAPRNAIHFSPSGRLVLVGGFGNLAGQMDIYDMEKDYRKICTIDAGNPSVVQWSPDSRYIMTATTSPRLRVDNGVKLWHVTGSIMYNEDMVELYNVSWRPALPEALPRGDPLASVPAPHESAAKYQATVKTPSKPVGAYRPPGARGSSTPLHFRREDEGGAAHVMSNGTSNIGPNRFGGQQRRAVPGAELLESGTRPAVPGAAPAGVPGAEGADENLSKSAMKNKKKRSSKKKDGEVKQDGGLAPPGRQNGPYSGNEGRSPERRGGQPNHRHNRSRSRNNIAGGDKAHHGQQQQQKQQQPPQNGTPAGAKAQDQEANGIPNKKLRGLTKKIRAIQDLEIRLANGEALEDTQLKKIATKAQVQKELDAVEKENR